MNQRRSRFAWAAGACARIAFEDPFAHGVVHVAMRITVCCALHRAPMLGIHRRGLRKFHSAPTPTHCIHPLTSRRTPPQTNGISDTRGVRMILPQVHLRKPCYDFSFL